MLKIISHKAILRKLKKCLREEIVLATDELADRIKGKDFARCVEIKEANSTCEWILSEIESLEETGEIS